MTILVELSVNLVRIVVLQLPVAFKAVIEDYRTEMANSGEYYTITFINT